MIPICKPTMVTIVILKVIECWNSYVWPRLITDDPNLYLVSNGIQEIRENGFGRENIPAMMAAVVVISAAPHRSVSGFPESGSWKGYQEEGQKDEKQMEKISGGRPSHSRCAFPHGLPRGEGGRRTLSFRIPLILPKNYEITFWAKNDTNKTQTDIYKKAISDFEALYPNITVNLKLYTDYGKIYNDVITNIATDTTPNVCITYPDHIATYLTGARIRWCRWMSCLTDETYGLGGSESGFRLSDARRRSFRSSWRSAAFDGHYLCPALHAFHRGLLCQ